MTEQSTRPRIFVGSSSEGRRVADELTAALDQDFDVSPWSQGVFGLSTGTLESLIKATETYDFAVFVLTPDDLVTSRNAAHPAARDNVLFEIGLFMGKLGRDSTFMVYCSNDKLDLPSDLAGITTAAYRRPADGNLQAALVPAMVKIRRGVESVVRRRVETEDEVANLQELNRVCAKEIRRLNSSIRLFITESEAKYLLDLSKDQAVQFRFQTEEVMEGFRNELRKLRTLGLFENRQGKAIGDIPNRGDLREFGQLTDLGREYIRLTTA